MACLIKFNLIDLMGNSKKQEETANQKVKIKIISCSLS